jgi:hypothetical protein
MRPDMGRLIIEDGRRGDGGPKTCYDKIRRVGEDYENLPSFESTSRHRKQDSNSQGDRLNPLKRYLESQVGRPWSEVFSEICAVNDKRTIRGYHLLTHLFQDVMVDGVQRGDIGGYQDFKVGPDGVLRKHDWRKTRRYSRPEKKKQPKVFKLGNGWEYQKLEGLWFRVHYRTDETVIPGHFTERTFSYGKKAELKYRYWINTQVRTDVVMDVKVSCGQKDLKEIRKLLAK